MKGRASGPPQESQDQSTQPDRAPLELLRASPLFDPEWYALQAGCPRDRKRSARHYVEKGGKRGLTPHPLFHPRFFAQALRESPARDPFVAFLENPELRGGPTHPLFDTAKYVEAHPTAATHPWGPLGHYLEVGATSGSRPNDWYVPDLAAQPQGLADWVRQRARESVDRGKAVPRTWSKRFDRQRAEVERERLLAFRSTGDQGQGPSADAALVSVIVPCGFDKSALEGAIRSVLEQTHSCWELLLVVQPDSPRLSAHLDAAIASDRLHVIQATGEASGLNAALERTSGEFVTWIFPGETWDAERLALLTAACVDPQYDGAHDTIEASDHSSPSRYAGGPFGADHLIGRASGFLSQMFLRREAVFSLEPLDETLPRGWETDFVYRAHQALRLCHLPCVGTRREPAIHEEARRPPPRDVPLVDHRVIETWEDVLINRTAIDWQALARSERDPSVVSVVIPTYNDWRLTTEAVRSVTAAEPPLGMAVEVVVVDNGSNMRTSVMLDSLPERFPGVKVVHSAVNHGFALGNNFALPHTSGAIVVFLNNDTTVADGWLPPLVEALDDPEVLGAQSLLVYPTGSVQSAGIAFPSCGGVPHPYLQGFPVEDAADAGSLHFSALTGAALALRFQDIVDLRGFDPLFLNGMEDADLCLRLKSHRDGHFTVVPASVVTHHESRTPGRFKRAVTNRLLYLDRWSDLAPRDDVGLWRAAGFDVVGHEIRNEVAEDRRLSVPEPVLSRRPAITVDEPRPRLRWAIKNPASAGHWGENWGDTHFARSLGRALRNLGQTVVIDHRPEFYRASGMLDDVVLTLRGREIYRPAFGQVNLAWVISHPDTVTRAEAATYDRVLAASEQWARRMSTTWGMQIETLLQATEPEMFHPDRTEPDSGYPVLFLGGSRHEFRPMVRMALEAGLPLSVVGSGWEEFVPPERIVGRKVANDEVGAMYRAAGVVLNDHWDSMRDEGFISNRLFDAAAAGARVITDPVQGLGDLFGRSVQVARDAGDLFRLADPANYEAIFGNDEERRQVSARVRDAHSFEVRAQKLLETALEFWSQRDRRRHG